MSGRHYIPAILFLWTGNFISIAYATSSNSQEADVGLTLGSSAAAKLLSQAAHNALRQPRQMQMELRSASGTPWFDPVAHVDSKNRITLSHLRMNFRNNSLEAEMDDIVVQSASNIFLLPLPFFLGEDTAHITAKIPKALVRLRVVDDYNVGLDECLMNVTDMQIHLEKAYLLNLMLSPFHQVLPRSLIHDSVCEMLGESLGKLRRRFAFEIPLASLIPEKFTPYLTSPNVSIFAQLESIVAHNEQLTASAVIEWTEMSTLPDSTSSTTSGENANEPKAPTPQPFTSQDTGSNSAESSRERSGQSAEGAHNAGLNAPSERLQLWVEDRLLNELMEHFRWDFEWMEENIPIDSPKLPKSTSAFLSALCSNCYFLVKVTANGTPHVESVNSSIVLKKSDKLFMKVVNPSRNVDAVFMNFALTLTVRLSPHIENGIFRTQVDLLETDIRMEGGAFPDAWRTFVQDLVKGMIMDVIWPGLKKEIETLSYGDGVQIPPYCGLEPNTARLHFDQGRLGASAALHLEELNLNQCLSQLRSKLPDPSKLFVIREDAF